MGTKNKKKLKKLDLLEMSNPQRIQLIKEVREKLRQKTVEAKLWQSLIDAEIVTINGNTVFSEQDSLKGLCFGDEARFK